MGMFVNATLRIASKDKEEVVNNEIIRMEDYMQKVSEFFRELDHGGSGQLTWEMFEANMENLHVKAYFQSLEIDYHHARDFFEMLDSDDSNAVCIDEFIEGCLRLRGGSRSVDVNMVLLKCGKLTQHVESLQRKSQRQLDILDKILYRQT